VSVPQLLNTALSVYAFILIARIILGWVTMFGRIPSSLTPLVRFIYEVTEPVMRFFRRFIPPVGGLDLSPIVIFIIIRILQSIIARSAG
jgi:YggT family protein